MRWPSNWYEIDPAIDQAAADGLARLSRAAYLSRSWDPSP